MKAKIYFEEKLEEGLRNLNLSYPKENDMDIIINKIKKEYKTLESKLE